MKEIHQKILDFVTSYILDYGYPPTNSEISNGVGYTSISTMFNHLRDMRAFGLIYYMDECPRTITVPGYRYLKMEKVRPIDVHKLCLVCRRRYSMESERCDCGGRLYVSGAYRSNLWIGGGAGGQGKEA